MAVATGSIYAQDPEKAAQEAIQAKRIADARRIYVELSERNPENLDYVVWIARLSSWLNEYEAAVRSYDRVLARQPDNFDALLGKSYVVMWQRDFPAAKELLTRAEKIAPESAELHLALARHAHFQGLEKEALAYVNRALSIEPGNKDARDLKSQIELPRPLEIRIGYESNRFTSPIPAGNMGSLSVGYISPQGTLIGQYEGWNKFNESVHRAGLSFSRRVRKGLTLLGGGIWAPGATVLAQQDYTAGLVQALPRRFVAGADYRYIRFRGSSTQVNPDVSEGANVYLLSPSIEYYFEKPIWVKAVIFNTWTEFLRTNNSVFSTAFMLNYNHQVSKPVQLRLFYARGAENYANLSIDRLGKFQANSYAGGFDLRLSAAYSLGIYYGYQSRSNDTYQKTFTLGLTIRQ